MSDVPADAQSSDPRHRRPPTSRLSVRHRYNPGGNRRINAVLYRMAITQLRCEPRAQAIFATARAKGHTKKEARRILKRHLSDVIYRRMIRDLAPHTAQPLLAA
jgi:transposase